MPRRTRKMSRANSRRRSSSPAVAPAKPDAAPPSAATGKKDRWRSTYWLRLSPQERRQIIAKLKQRQSEIPPTWKRSGLLRVEAELKEADKEEYFALLKDPASSLLDARRWLAARGYQLGKSSVGHHRRRFRARLFDARKAAEMAHAFVAVSRELGSADPSEAVASHAEQQMMQTFFNLLHAQQSDEKLDIAHWLNVQKAVGLLVKNRGMVEQVRADFEKRVRKAAKIAAEAAKKNVSGKDIADKVWEILGMKREAEETYGDAAMMRRIEEQERARSQWQAMGNQSERPNNAD